MQARARALPLASLRRLLRDGPDSPLAKALYPALQKKPGPLFPRLRFAGHASQNSGRRATDCCNFASYASAGQAPIARNHVESPLVQRGCGSKSALQVRGVDGLQKMHVYSGVSRPLLVGFLSPACNGDDFHRAVLDHVA